MIIINEALSNVIRTDKTGTSYYDNFLNKRDHDYMKLAKGLQGKIVNMSPQHYIDEIARNIFHCSNQQVMNGVSKSDIEKYASMMKSGTKFNLPYINYTNDGQEGRHRALAAQLLGVNSIPVLVVTKFDPRKELGLVGSMRLWYGHTIEYENKDGKTIPDHVGMDVDAIKKEVAKIKRSGNYK